MPTGNYSFQGGMVFTSDPIGNAAVAPAVHPKLQNVSGVQAFRLLALKYSLKLETLGLCRSRGPSAYSIIKAEFDLKGSKSSVLAQYEKMLRDSGIPPPTASSP